MHLRHSCNVIEQGPRLWRTRTRRSPSATPPSFLLNFSPSTPLYFCRAGEDTGHTHGHFPGGAQKGAPLNTRPARGRDRGDAIQCRRCVRRFCRWCWPVCGNCPATRGTGGAAIARLAGGGGSGTDACLVPDPPGLLNSGTCREVPPRVLRGVCDPYNGRRGDAENAEAATSSRHAAAWYNAVSVGAAFPTAEEAKRLNR